MNIKDREYHKRYARKKFLHEQKRKGKPYHGYFIDEAKEYTRLSKKESRPPKKHKIVLPSEFSLVYAFDDTIIFFEELLRQIREHRPVFIDSKHVETITPDAILYFILLLEEIKERHEQYSISGNFPKNRQSRQMMQQSGFMNYVNSRTKSYKHDADIFTIREGRKVDPDVAKNVLGYVKEHLGIQKPNPTTKAIYTIIVEAMANTHNHAAQSKVQGEQKWYLMAYYTDDGDVHFVFLDSGAGVPKTIRKNFKDIVARIFSHGEARDHKLIRSALDGDFRTKTGQQERGKGLPKMNALAKYGHIKDLVIISNKGFVNSDDGITKLLDEKFHGTLLSWKVVRKEAS
jgi:anti-sigma regulatory factor (Ser/Thr protein kinase)